MNDRPDKATPKPSPRRVADARFVAAGAKTSDLPPGASFEVAFAGRSNVGKSSLLNSLMERRSLVRTSKTPGATRTVNVFEARLVSGVTVALADLPGYGYAQRAKSERKAWGTMLEGYLKDRAELRALVVLIDVRRGANEDDRSLIEFAKTLPRPLPVVVCATKIDKLPRARRVPEVAQLGRALGVAAVGYSAVTHDGRDALWSRILTLRTDALGDVTRGASDAEPLGPPRV